MAEPDLARPARWRRLRIDQCGGHSVISVYTRAFSVGWDAPLRRFAPGMPLAATTGAVAAMALWPASPSARHEDAAG